MAGLLAGRRAGDGLGGGPAEAPRRDLQAGEPAGAAALGNDPRGYGTLLGQTLFQGAVRDALREGLSAVRGSGAFLGVLLDVKAPALRELNWHWLCAELDGNNWVPLALGDRTAFSLAVASDADRHFRTLGRHNLRALALIADPGQAGQAYHLEPFDAQAVADGLLEGLCGGDKRPPIDCHLLGQVRTALGPASLDDLADRLRAECPTLLHLVCHGRFNVPDEGETTLFLASRAGAVAPVTATELLERLRALPVPHFVFLTVCHSGAAGEGNLAQRLVRDLGIPAVVAMTDQVMVTTAVLLTPKFYQRLREHGQVGLALAEASSALPRRFDLQVPAVYTRPSAGSDFLYSLDAMKRWCSFRCWRPCSASAWITGSDGHLRSRLVRNSPSSKSTL
jgi:hypothetical protein